MKDVQKQIKMIVKGHMEYIYNEAGKYIDYNFIEDDDAPALFKDENNNDIDATDINDIVMNKILSRN